MTDVISSMTALVSQLARANKGHPVSTAEAGAATHADMRRSPAVLTVFFALSLSPVALGGCSCTTDPELDGGEVDGGGLDAEGLDAPGSTMDTPLADGAVPDGGVVITDDGGTTWTCIVTSCGGHTLQCGDCIDNDGDGRVDSHDPECLGPCDNTEGAGLNAGIGGETGGPCAADCYFDFGNGPGNDDCHWDHRCDPLAVAPDFPPEGPGCAYDEARVGSRDCPDTQSDMCHEFCAPLTPNGCDCFGCCTFDALAGTGPGGSDGFVWIGALGSDGEGTCTFADLDDPAACPPCTPVGDCFNDCGRCELCVGRETLPADCFPPDAGMTDVPNYDGGMPDLRCRFGEQPCGLPGDAECGADFYCITGCCQSILM